MNDRGILKKIMEVLAVMDGHFVFKGPDNEEYVIAKKHNFGEQERETNDNIDDSQGELEEWASVGDIMEHYGEPTDHTSPPPSPTLGEGDDIGLSETVSKKVSFEPLKGDLPPNLQD